MKARKNFSSHNKHRHGHAPDRLHDHTDASSDSTALSATVDPDTTFATLGLNDVLVETLAGLGYETPSPIQAATIPVLLEGRDVLGQAQTGTGKTAAFALPILARLEDPSRVPQAPAALVLAPTRELALQVAEAFQKYADRLPGFSVLALYGGQAYGPQLGALRRGVHVVVGTPGRVVDHLERGTLKLDRLTTLVLDEADEMLRMGFIDDVENVLKATPDTRQVALFSATMPAPIRRIAQTYQKSPAEITIRAKTTTNTSISQRVCMVGAAPGQKLEALTRVLETETFDGAIVFSRTRLGSEEIADRLAAEGHAVSALNGDMDQKARERVVGRLKDGSLDIIVATDVAARGLDVERISLVVNFDIPTDPESYVHRIGRTGRAGRSGEAILLMTPRERHLLRLIERTSRQQVTPMEIPSVEAVNKTRVARFKKALVERLEADRAEAADTSSSNGRRTAKDVKMFRQIVEGIEQEQGVPMADIAAALAHMAQGGKPLLLEGHRASPSPADDPRQGTRPARGFDDLRQDFNGPSERAPKERSFKTPTRREAEPGMGTFRVEVGYKDDLKPGHLVAAISNEAGLDGRYIGRIEIFDEFSLLDLPDDMPDDILKHLGNVFVRKRKLRMSRVDTDGSPLAAPASSPSPAAAPSPKKKKDRPQAAPAAEASEPAPAPTPKPSPSAHDDFDAPQPPPAKAAKKPKAKAAPVETVLPTAPAAVAAAPKKKKKSKSPDNIDDPFGDVA